MSTFSPIFKLLYQALKFYTPLELSRRHFEHCYQVLEREGGGGATLSKAKIISASPKAARLVCEGSYSKLAPGEPFTVFPPLNIS